MNLPIKQLIIEGNMGEDYTSPTMLSLEQLYQQIQTKQNKLYRQIDQYNYIVKQHVSTESFIVKDLVSSTLGDVTISEEGFRDTLSKIWNYLKVELNTLRNEIFNYFNKVMSQIEDFTKEWDKVRKDYLKFKQEGKLVEVISKDENKDWFKLALEKKKLTYLNINVDGTLFNGKDRSPQPLKVDLNNFITKAFKLINSAYRENNYLGISSPLSSLFSETFILFNKVKYETNDPLMREVYRIARYGQHELFIPVIPIYDRTSASYINEFRPIHYNDKTPYIEGTTVVPICTHGQFDFIESMIKEIKSVASISSKNYKRISSTLSKEDKQFTDIVVSASDTRLETVEQLQKVITFINRISTLELEYSRILVRYGLDLVYFAKCALLVMKNYNKQLTS